MLMSDYLNSESYDEILSKNYKSCENDYDD